MTDKQRPLHEAEIEKIRAETKKVQAEAREATAKAESAKLKAATERFVHERETEKRERELASFGHERIYNFTSRVSEESAQKCIAELRYWHKIDPGCDITIVFDTPGGSVFDGMNLFDYIQELRADGHHVTTATRGMAASMGGILLQAGDKRIMSSESYILIHEVSTVSRGSSGAGDLEDELVLVHKIQNRMLDIFAARSKMSKVSLGRKWKRRDWWIDSTEALKLGLIDEVR